VAVRVAYHDEVRMCGRSRVSFEAVAELVA